MAMDEVLLETASETETTILRFYRWNKATVSLGYFQHHEDRKQHPASQTLPLVRRCTGGGAIVHDQEITYSLMLNNNRSDPIRSHYLYDLVHKALISALAEQGISAHMACSGVDPTERRKPYLCFQRQSEFDVMVATNKIAGSAQRRCHGAVLQHGSVLLRRSSSAPELPGIAELTGGQVDGDRLMQHLTSNLEKRLHIMFHPSSVTTEEHRRAQQGMTEKHGSYRWIRRR